jgi:hypothetical protein
MKWIFVDLNIMDIKQIGITGTNNRYMMKKVLKEPTVIKKREVSQSWTFTYDDQVKLVNGLDETNTDDASKAIFSEINKKISGYKQQDKKKGVYEEHMFIDLVDVIEKLRECELRCHYCSKEMLVLYDMTRESRQWSVDRIDNDKGHNMGNYHLACLECNLKRRRTDDEKFLLSKSTFRKGGTKKQETNPTMVDK